MPGLFGICSSEPGDLVGLCDGMAGAMDPEGRMERERFAAPEHGFAMGRAHLGIFDVGRQPVQDSPNQLTGMLHGELYGNTSGHGDARWLTARYAEDGATFAAGLSGIFHAAIFDGRRRRLVLISDKFGLQPLYYTALDGRGLAFAAEVKALLTVPGVARTVDLAAVADFMHYGQVLGDKTLFSGIKLLPPGTALVYDPAGGRLEPIAYFQLASLFAEQGGYDAPDKAWQAVERLVQAIAARTGQQERLGLSLSGGLDSRGILAGLGERAEGLATYTLGVPGCADQGLARRMAAIAGTRHEFVTLDQRYLKDFESMAAAMVRLSDGFYHPHESTEMLALEYFKRAPFSILLRGHGGETAKAALAYPVMVTPAVAACRTAEAVLSSIFNITNLVLRDVDAQKLFVGEAGEAVGTAPMASLRASCGEAAERLAPADVCIFYYIREHIRRQVVASLDIFRTRVEIRMPYVDEAYLESLLRLPVSERNSGEIHLKLIRRCMPALIKVPNSNTGAPLDAGPLRLLAADKFAAVMKRLGVKGYRHYTEFQKWHRQAFREASERIIFSDRARQRGIYDMDHLRAVFDMHMAGKKDYGHLLGTVTGIELWHRLFVD